MKGLKALANLKKGGRGVGKLKGRDINTYFFSVLSHLCSGFGLLFKLVGNRDFLGPMVRIYLILMLIL